jgi:hypothetical protein
MSPIARAEQEWKNSAINLLVTQVEHITSRDSTTPNLKPTAPQLYEALTRTFYMLQGQRNNAIYQLDRAQRLQSSQPF